jgi:hypothetical protein
LAAVASQILRETIKKLKDRRALLERQIKGPLKELAQIEADLKALGARGGGGQAASGRTRSRTASTATGAPARAAPGAHQAAILRAIRNGATTPEEVAEKTGLAPATVRRSVTISINQHKLITRGPNGLTLTKGGRVRLAELEER